MNPRAAEAELKGPELPEAAAHVWGWFIELCASRQHGAYAVQSLTYAEIEAWSRLTGRALRPFEVAWLRTLDALWLAPEESDGRSHDDVQRPA